jgi:hypothetical protein
MVTKQRSAHARSVIRLEVVYGVRDIVTHLGRGSCLQQHTR